MLSEDAVGILRALEQQRVAFVQPLYDVVDEVRRSSARQLIEANSGTTDLDPVGRACLMAQAYGQQGATLAFVVGIRKMEDRLAADMMASRELEPLVETRTEDQQLNLGRARAEVAKERLEDLLATELGFRDGAEVTADGSAENDLADERLAVVLDFIKLVRKSAWPESHLQAVRELITERQGGADAARLARQARSGQAEPE